MTVMLCSVTIKQEGKLSNIAADFLRGKSKDYPCLTTCTIRRVGMHVIGDKFNLNVGDDAWDIRLFSGKLGLLITSPTKLTRLVHNMT